jgi:hypothetical protein
VYRDDKYLKEYGVCSDKGYAIQILDYEEIIEDKNDVLCVIREWLPGENGGILSKKKEILLNKKMRYHEVNEALKNFGLIPDNCPPENYDM